MDQIAQKLVCKICINRNNNSAVWVRIGHSGALLFRFSRNSCDSSIWGSITWNRTKLCMKYTIFERWCWYKHCECSLIGSAAAKFIQIFGKNADLAESCRFINRMCKMFICESSRFTFSVDSWYLVIFDFDCFLN